MLPIEPGSTDSVDTFDTMHQQERDFSVYIYVRWTNGQVSLIGKRHSIIELEGHETAISDYANLLGNF